MKTINEVRVLIVCREQEDIILYTRIFKDLGCEVCSASDGSLAINLFNSYREHGRPFDIVCTDYLLKTSNGITLGKQLKKIDPGILLVLFPTIYLADERIKNDFENFGGFWGYPDITSQGILRLIDQAKMNRKEGQSSG